MSKLKTETQLPQTTVMPSYFDKANNKFKEGDICFYSEYDGIRKDFHYANGIYLIMNIDGILYPKCKVYTMTDGKKFEDYDEPFCKMLKLENYCKDEISKEFLIIGNIDNDEYMLSKEYAVANYSVV
ncbi:hypothetical protein NTJ12_002457 [Flavobacterium psychrophilum]|nr:hypothetical protein [Flavobacterium psychrophilum]